MCLWRKARRQQLSRLVVTHDPDRQDVHSEVGKVADRIGAAAGDDLAIAVLQNQHGRFARDARYLAEDKLIGDQICEDGYRELGERFDDLPQAAVFFNMLCHQYAGSQYAGSSGATQDFLTSGAFVH